MCSGAACQARGGPWQARVGVDGAGRTAVSKNLNKLHFKISPPLLPQKNTFHKNQASFTQKIGGEKHDAISESHRELEDAAEGLCLWKHRAAGS